MKKMAALVITLLFLLNCTNAENLIYGASTTDNTGWSRSDEDMVLLNTIKLCVMQMMNNDINDLYAVSTTLLGYCEGTSEESLFLEIDASASSFLSLYDKHEIVFDTPYSGILNSLSSTFDHCYVSVHEGKVEFRKFLKFDKAEEQAEYYDCCLIYSEDRRHSSWECDLISSDDSFGYWYLSLIPYE